MLRGLAKRIFGSTPSYEVDRIPRREQREIFWSVSRPVLEQGGVEHFKGNRAWRVLDDKTDVIEMRFLSDRECRSYHHAIESALMVSYGSYFHCIPSTYDDSLMFGISGLLTPQEHLCHLRYVLERTYDSPLLANDESVWCFEVSPPPRETIERSLASAIRESMLPRLNAVSTTAEFLRYLESAGSEHGVGAPGSPGRNYRSGLAALRLGEREVARQFLQRALPEFEQMLLIGGIDHEGRDSPLWRQKCVIEGALNELGSGEPLPADSTGRAD